MSQEKAFSNQDARDAWNDSAWEDFVESGKDFCRHKVHGPWLLAACEPLQGLGALDLGCAQGWFSRQLARRGARVVAIDLAEEQLAFAHKHEEEEPLGIEYHHMNASEVNQHWPVGSFDLVSGMSEPAPSSRAPPRSSSPEDGWSSPSPTLVPTLPSANGSCTSLGKRGR